MDQHKLEFSRLQRKKKKRTFVSALLFPFVFLNVFKGTFVCLSYEE